MSLHTPLRIPKWITTWGFWNYFYFFDLQACAIQREGATPVAIHSNRTNRTEKQFHANGTPKIAKYSWTCSMTMHGKCCWLKHLHVHDSHQQTEYNCNGETYQGPLSECMMICERGLRDRDQDTCASGLTSSAITIHKVRQGSNRSFAMISYFNHQQHTKMQKTINAAMKSRTRILAFCTSRGLTYWSWKCRIFFSICRAEFVEIKRKLIPRRNMCMTESGELET